MKKSANRPWADGVAFSRLVRETRLLPRSFYARPALEVAPDVLGAVIVHGRMAARIVETEAYLGETDPASHASRGLTKRTRVIFGPPGHAYVYFIYGMYECLNLVTDPDGRAGCVLIRALEPLCGLEQMRVHRPGARRPEQLASGPGKLTQALDITRRLNGVDITRGLFSVRYPRRPELFEIEVTPRIGVSRSADWPLRFLIAGSRFVSTPRGPVLWSDHVAAEALS